MKSFFHARNEKWGQNYLICPPFQINRQELPNQALEWMRRTSATLSRQACRRTTQLNVPGDCVARNRGADFAKRRDSGLRLPHLISENIKQSSGLHSYCYVAS